MNIKGLDKAKVLYGLWLGSKEQGNSWLGRFPLTEEYCRRLLEHTTYFDYLAGRVIKVDFSTDDLDLGLYDRDNNRSGEEAILDYLTQP